MSWINHINDTPLESELESCSKCGKTYFCYKEDQIPGSRMRDYNYCPYCGNMNGSSMEVEFNTRKLTDSEIQHLKTKDYDIDV